MTNDEIDKLEAGPELDTLVAEKVMGWQRGMDLDGSTAHRYFISGGNVYANPVSRRWSPSTDIAAAWEVLEKLRDLDVFCDLTASYYDPVRKRWTKWTVELNDDSKFEDESASLAICRAALKAVNQ